MSNDPRTPVVTVPSHRATAADTSPAAGEVTETNQPRQDQKRPDQSDRGPPRFDPYTGRTLPPPPAPAPSPQDAVSGLAYPVQPGAFMQVTARMTQAGQELMCSMVYRYDGPSQITNGQIALSDVAYHWHGTTNQGPGHFGYYWAQLASTLGVSLYSVHTQWIHPIRYGKFESTTTPTAGVNAEEPVPTGVAGRITFKCERAGRHYIGGMSIPCIARNFVGIDSKWTAPGMTALGNMASYMRQAIQINPGTMTYGPFYPVVFQRLDPANSGLITTGTAKPEVRTQRRRVVGHGI